MQKLGDVGVDPFHQVRNQADTGAQAVDDLGFAQLAMRDVLLDLGACVANHRAVRRVDDAGSRARMRCNASR
jgi:hypothetical protein